MMISLMQVTGGITNIIANLIELIRYYVRGAINQARSIVSFLLRGSVESQTAQTTTTQIDTAEIVADTAEHGAVFTPFNIAVAVLVVLIVIFAVIIHEQGKEEKYNKKQVFEQAHFSHETPRVNVEKSAENESEESAEVKE